jgi:two-component system response regulator AlgR
MKVLIVDDEKPARERLRNLIQDMNLGEVVGEASNGREALTETDRVHPDILLLDIRMPEMDGLETASHLSKLENPPAVIFTTAYNDYALQAFEQQAVDYLLKPVRRERLERALAAARRLTRVQLSALRSNDPQGRTHISARIHGSVRLVPVEEVRYLQAAHKYVTVNFADGEVLVEDSLKSLEEEFGDRFVRIHRNALVARSWLESLERTGMGSYCVKLRGCDTCLEVSRRHLSGLRRLMRS